MPENIDVERLKVVIERLSLANRAPVVLDIQEAIWTLKPNDDIKAIEGASSFVEVLSVSDHSVFRGPLRDLATDKALSFCSTYADASKLLSGTIGVRQDKVSVKVKELERSELERISTPAEAQSALKLPWNRGVFYNSLLSAIQDKWDELSQAQIKEADTVEKAKAAFYAARPGVVQDEALAKWNELSILDAKNTQNLFTIAEVFANAPPNSEAKKFSAQRWNELSEEAVKTAVSESQIGAAFYCAPIGSRARRLALTRLYEHDFVE